MVEGRGNPLDPREGLPRWSTWHQVWEGGASPENLLKPGAPNHRRACSHLADGHQISDGHAREAREVVGLGDGVSHGLLAELGHERLRVLDAEVTRDPYS